MENRDVRAELERWIANVSDKELAAELAEMKKAADAGDDSAAVDAFFQDLAFGTAGLRGTLGAGTNRMNIYTVGRATQGFADYLNANFENPSVAIARDSRNKGELFVQVTASILAANGIVAHVYPKISPVPTLSFAVRDLGCSGGICMTASHNPAAYNGYKAYGPDGCQITSEAAKAISASIANTDAFSGVKTMGFDEAVASGMVKWIDDAVLERYYDAVLSKSVSSLSAEQVAEAPLKLVYTPLNGTGLIPVTTVLERAGIADITVVPEQREPNGDFPTCPYPNPEIREAMQKGIDLCEEVHPDLLLATDPDADRVGVACKDGDDYTLLTGNEMGVLLLDYIARMRSERGEDLSDKVAVTTIVSSAMVDALAAEYGFELRRCLTGFKYIGDIITDPESPVTEMAPIAVEEPTMAVVFEASTSPLVGREGEIVGGRQLKERLMREKESNISMRIDETEDKSGVRVAGRGVLHLSVLMETMRREGFEFQVGRPQVVYKTDEHGNKLEPIEEATVDVPNDYSGKAIEVMGTAGGIMEDMFSDESMTHLTFSIPSRGTMGLKTRILNATHGEAVLFHHFREYGPYSGEMDGRKNGCMIAMATDKAVAYALDTLQQRGRLFVKPGDECYEGMIVGESAKEGDMVVNVSKTKNLGNQRSSTADKAIQLTPPITFTLEEALEYIEDDELVEVTPESIRLRKRILSTIERKKANKK